MSLTLATVLGQECQQKDEETLRRAEFGEDTELEVNILDSYWLIIERLRVSRGVCFCRRLDNPIQAGFGRQEKGREEGEWRLSAEVSVRYRSKVEHRIGIAIITSLWIVMRDKTLSHSPTSKKG